MMYGVRSPEVRTFSSKVYPAFLSPGRLMSEIIASNRWLLSLVRASSVEIGSRHHPSLVRRVRCWETSLSDVGPVRSRQAAKLIGSEGENRERSAACRPDGLEALKVFIEQQLDRL